MKKSFNMQKPIAIITSLAMAVSLAMAPGGVARADEAASVPEWAIDDGTQGESSRSAELPASFDMRDEGWVTPVKLQNPWGTCWAFGAISATESSILSAAGSTYDKTKFDLSERHLAWFAMQPVTAAEDPAQAGEGNYPIKGGNDSYQTGGPNMFVTTLFSQGVGPVTEQEFPYRGVGEDGASHTTKPSLPYEQFEQDPEQGTLIVLADLNNKTIEYEEAYLRDLATMYHTTYEAELAEAVNYVRGLYTHVDYSKNDDWSIPTMDDNGASNRFKHAGLILKDGNVLPEYWNADKTALNDASLTAMKQELANGRGIVINYRADQAQPGAASDSTYINKDTWAQYTFQKVQQNHAVCIVGWDDDYSKDNFAHYIFVRDPKTGEIVNDDEGNAQVYDNSLEITTPPGDGAWIVKNSWGSQTDATTDDLGNYIGYGEYGVRNEDGQATGYFYLSYYDLTIEKPETMSFSSNLLGPTGLVSIFQHDYMPAQGGFYNVEPSGDVMSSANVFDLKEEDGDQLILSVGGRTSDRSQRATFAIYQLNDGATNPTDGKLLCRTSSSFDYAGYHRLDLEQPLAIRAGHKYSIVSTVTTQDASGDVSYSVSANQGLSKMIREYLYNQMSEEDRKKVNPTYNVAVVNEGESFLYKDGEWVDWSSYVNAIPAPAPEPGEPAVEKYIDVLPIDNFSLKMYAEPADIPEVEYHVIEGDGAAWTKGSNADLSFTFKRFDETETDDTTFSHFASASVDDTVIERDKDYTASEGSVKVSLKPSYLGSLSAGEHKITATFDDGTATAKFTVAVAPVPTTDPKPTTDAEPTDTKPAASTTTRPAASTTTQSTASTTTRPASTTSTLAKTADPTSLATAAAAATAGVSVLVFGRRKRR